MALKYDIADIKLAKEGKQKIEWAEKNMPVLRQIRERFKKTKPLKGLNMACCLHVTTETENLMRTLKAGGANVALCASRAFRTPGSTWRKKSGMLSMGRTPSALVVAWSDMLSRASA